MLKSLQGTGTGACALAGVSAWGAGLTSQSYVQDGLVAQFDAIENVGVGLTHDAGATVWRDLKGSASLTLKSGAAWGERVLVGPDVLLHGRSVRCAPLVPVQQRDAGSGCRPHEPPHVRERGARQQFRHQTREPRRGRRAELGA